MKMTKELTKAFKGLIHELQRWRETSESFKIYWTSNGLLRSSYMTIDVKMREKEEGDSS